MEIDTRFHCVYLLTSLDPQCEGRFYIGYTVNPLRRLRQHNGELTNGARRTSRRGRPWTLVCCVSGFTEDRAALKFEWCWQHPTESARLKHTAPAVLRGLHNLPYAVATLSLLVRAELFNRLELTLHVFELDRFNTALAQAISYHALGARGGSGKRTHIAGLETRTSDVGVDTTIGFTEGDLFHIQETARDAFEKTYLGSDRGCDLAGESDLSISCPFSPVALSQTVLQEWGSGSTSSSSPPASPCSSVPSLKPRCSSSSSSNSNEDEVVPRNNRHNNGGGDSDRPRHTVTWSLIGSQQHEDASLPHHNENSLLPCAQNPSGVLSQQQQQQQQSTTQVHQRRKVPLRFKYYTEADYVRDHLREQSQLENGLLPCTLCALPLRAPYVMRCARSPFCGLRTHIACLAMWMQHYCGDPSHGAARRANAERNLVGGSHSLGSDSAPAEWTAADVSMPRLAPASPCPCPLCGELLQWASRVKDLKGRAVVEARAHAQARRRRMEECWQARLTGMEISRRQRKGRARQAGGGAGGEGRKSRKVRKDPLGL